MRGSSKPDVKDLRPESKSSDALTAGRAVMIAAKIITIALIHFHAIFTSRTQETI